MAFSFISISSDSSEESAWTSTTRVILFGTIPTTIPPTIPTTDLPVIYDDTLLTPTIPHVAPTIQYTSPFIDTDSSDSDTPDSPPSQDPYETIPDGVLKMLTGRKRVRSLPTHRIALRHPLDSSLLDSSLRHSSSGYAILETSYDSPTATSERPSRKRCRSPSVLVSSPIHEALSPVYADLLPPPKRIRDSDLVTDLEAYIDECIAYVDAIRARRIDDRDVVETVAEEEIESRERHANGAVEVTYETLGGLVQRFHDHVVEIPVHRIQVIESEQRLQGHKGVGVGQQRGLTRWSGITRGLEACWMLRVRELADFSMVCRVPRES
ncbi:hypothetical protein Tco_0233596 [Tanacetum coccineum]